MKELVIIPAYNESGTIGTVVRSLRLMGRDVLVVDDASRDVTALLAREAGAKVVSHASNIGAWGAMQTGIRYGLRHGYEMAVTMDGDGQHRPEDVQYIAGPVRSGEADVVVGSFCSRGDSKRQFVWKILRGLSRSGVQDMTSGFRAYSHAAMKVLAGQQASFLEYQDLGVVMLLTQAGMRMQEVDVTMYSRACGKSKIFTSPLLVMLYIIKTLMLGISKMDSSSSKKNPKC